MADDIDSVGLEAVIRGVATYAANAGKVVTSNKAINKSLGAVVKGAALFRKALSTAMKVGAIAVVAGLAASINVFKNFDQAMTESIAIMGDVGDAMRTEMEQTAREVAKTTTFSMTEAAESYFFLASAGLSAAQSVAALPQVAQFAQAGMFDMALATDLLTDAQSALGLVTDDTAQNIENMARVSDVLVKANTKANATVEQFSTALTREAGAALKSANKDIEEGVAVLAAFADQGVKGQIAGSSLSRILRLMGSAALKNKEAFSSLNIEVFDAEDNWLNFADIIGDMEVALLDLSDADRIAALETLGFSARIQGVILPLLGTSEKIREYEAALRAAGGITAEVADKQLESLSAQFSLLRSAIEDLLFTIGKGLEPALRSFVRTLRQDVIPWIEVRLPRAIEKIEQLFRDWQPTLKESAILLKDIGGAIRTAFQWILDNEARIVAALFAISIAMIGIWGPGGVILTGVAASILVIGLFQTEIEDLEGTALSIRIGFQKMFIGIATGFKDLIDLFDLGSGLINKALGAITGKDINEVLRNLDLGLKELVGQQMANVRVAEVLDLQMRALAVGMTEAEIKIGLASGTLDSLAAAQLLAKVTAIELGATAPTAAQFYRAVQRGAEAAGVSVNQFTLDIITSVKHMKKLSDAFIAVVKLTGLGAGLAQVREFGAEIDRLQAAIARESGINLGIGVGGPTALPPGFGDGSGGGGGVADSGEDVADAFLQGLIDGVRQGTLGVVDAINFLKSEMIEAASTIITELLGIAEATTIVTDIIAKGFVELADVARLIQLGQIDTAIAVAQALAGISSPGSDEILAAINKARRAQIRAIFPTFSNFHEGGFVPAGQTVTAQLHGPEVIVPIGSNTMALRGLTHALRGMGGSQAGGQFSNYGNINLLAQSNADNMILQTLSRALGVA